VRGTLEDDRDGNSNDQQGEGPDELVICHESAGRREDVEEEAGVELLIKLVVSSDELLEHLHQAH